MSAALNTDIPAPSPGRVLVADGVVYVRDLEEHATWRADRLSSLYDESSTLRDFVHTSVIARQQRS